MALFIIARVQIFNTEDDYRLFESILEEGKERTAMRILACCIMPNHWHLVLSPKQDGGLIHLELRNAIPVLKLKHI